VCDLIVDVVIISFPIQRPDSFYFELRMALVECLRLVLAGRLDRFVGRGNPKGDGALTGNNKCQLAEMLHRDREAIVRST
jgi:hypothetical protein